MPTPIEILLDPLSLIILAMYAVLMLWEALFPARKLPHVRYWKTRSLTVFAVFFYLSSYLPLFVDPYLENYKLFDLTNLGTLGGTFVAVMLYEAFVFIWHFVMHKSNFLWLTFHQMHHSAERVDTYGAFYFSILDMIGFTMLGSFTLALFIGVTPQAITGMLLVTTFFSIFQHANIKTPQWIGYFIQRPESHSYHHAKNIHRHNYSDVPIFDIIFGTFYNPKEYEYETGFYPGASSRIFEMLTFQDINEKPERLKSELNS